MLALTDDVCNSKGFQILINDLCKAVEGIDEGSKEERKTYSDLWENTVLKFIDILNDAFSEKFGSKVRRVDVLSL